MSSRDLRELELHDSLDRLERRLARLPSKGFIIAAMFLHLIVVALLLVFQARISSVINKVLPGL